MTNPNELPHVAVMIITYNAQQYLGDLFVSLAKTDYPQDKLHVVVLDNASGDGTAQTIRASYPKVHVITSLENTGFAKGNNIAAAFAQAWNPKYLVLLNHDTEVGPLWLVNLVRTADSDSTIGIAQSLLLLHPQKNLINSLGNEIHFLGFGYSRGYREPYRAIEPPSYQATEIPYASGAAMLLRNEVYKKIGLFDERFFMYHEDLDLGWRARLWGYRIVLAPSSVVYHKYLFSKSITKYYWMERNRFITLLQNYHILTMVLVAPFLLCMELGLLFQSLRKGWWREKLRVYQYFLKLENWHAILSARKEIQRNRVISDREATRLFTGRIWYQEIHSPLLTYIANPFFNTVWWILRKMIWW